MEHAERNAIYNACITGLSLVGCTLYINAGVPCADCARGVIQSGIAAVIVHHDGQKVWDKVTNGAWDDSQAEGEKMLQEAEVVIRWWEGGLLTPVGYVRNHFVDIQESLENPGRVISRVTTDASVLPDVKPFLIL